MPDDDDLYERGRAIFERLRTAEPPRPTESDVPDVPEPPAPDPPGGDLWDDENDPIQPDGDERPSWSVADHVDLTLHEDAPVVDLPPSTDFEPGPAAPAVDEGPAQADAPVDPEPEAPTAAPEMPEPVSVSLDPGIDDLIEDITPAEAPLVEEADSPAASEAVWVTASTLEAPTTVAPVEDVPASAPALEEAEEPAAREDLTTRSPSHFRRPLPRVLAVANQKGGVGKTTTSVNLGASIAELGYRVLVIDLDPQGNATTGLGVNPRNLDASMYDVILNDLPIEDCIEPSAVKNLFVAPASLDLAGAEIELVPAFSRELRLRRALEAIQGDYDFVFIDCPPSLGLLTVNGLTAATELLVPIQCEYYALEGLSQLLRNVGLVQKNLNPALDLSVIVLVMYDARTKLSDQVVQEVRAHFGDKVCRNVIPRTVRLSEAPSFGQPIIAFDPSSRGAIAYRELAKEVSGGAP